MKNNDKPRKQSNAQITIQELINAGFKESMNKGDYFIKVTDELQLHGDTYELFLKTNNGAVIKQVKPSKLYINKEFEHFGQPKLNFEAKKYDWESCISRLEKGFYIETGSDIMGSIEMSKTNGSLESHKNIIPTKAHAEKLLVISQLMTICHALNEDFKAEEENKNGNIFSIGNPLSVAEYEYCNSELIQLNSRKAAEILLRDNRELLEQFYKNQ